MAISINNVHILEPQVVTLGDNVDNYKTTSSILRITPTSAISISGFNMGEVDNHDGAILFLLNASTNVLHTITLLHDSNSSSVENRIQTASGLAVVIGAKGPARLIYDPNPSRRGWWVI